MLAPEAKLTLVKRVSIALGALVCILGAEPCLPAVGPMRCTANPSICSLRIVGTITSADARAITRIQSEVPKNFGVKFGLLVVDVDSPGGDVDAALQIGRALRLLRAQVLVWSEVAPQI